MLGRGDEAVHTALTSRMTGCVLERFSRIPWSHVPYHDVKIGAIEQEFAKQLKRLTLCKAIGTGVVGGPAGLERRRSVAP